MLSCSFRYAVDHCVVMLFLCCKLWKQLRKQQNIHKICVKISCKKLDALTRLLSLTLVPCCERHWKSLLFLPYFLAFCYVFFAISLFPPTLYIKFYRVDISHLYSLQKYHNLSDLCYSLFYWQALAPYNKHFCISRHFDMKL